MKKKLKNWKKNEKKKNKKFEKNWKILKNIWNIKKKFEFDFLNATVLSKI